MWSRSWFHVPPKNTHTYREIVRAHNGTRPLDLKIVGRRSWESSWREINRCFLDLTTAENRTHATTEGEIMPASSSSEGNAGGGGGGGAEGRAALLGT